MVSVMSWLNRLAAPRRKLAAALTAQLTSTRRGMGAPTLRQIRSMKEKSDRSSSASRATAGGAGSPLASSGFTMERIRNSPTKIGPKNSGHPNHHARPPCTRKKWLVAWYHTPQPTRRIRPT